jgi:hypothetical protein
MVFLIWILEDVCKELEAIMQYDGGLSREEAARHLWARAWLPQ